MPRKSNPDKPKVNPELDGFDIQINEFGEIVSSFDVQKLNAFLDKTVDDKKFRGVDVVKRDDEKPIAGQRIQRPNTTPDSGPTA